MEITTVYPWVSIGRVYVVNEQKDNSEFVVATLGDNARPIRLTGDTAAISAFVSKQFDGRFPGTDRLSSTALFFQHVTIGPTAVIGSAAFLSDQKKFGIERWLKGREKDPAVFERLCVGVKVCQRENEWELQFNLFNVAGGVTSVHVSGRKVPFTIRQINVDEVKPPGEFYYVLVG